MSGLRSAARRAAPWILLLFAACDEHIGCTPVLTTENGQLELHDEHVIAGACRRLREVGPMLVGTSLCPTYACGADVPGCADEEGNAIDGTRVAACFAQSIDGPAELLDGCLHATAAGEVTWSFTVQPCPARADGYVPADDRLVLPIVDTTEIVAHFEAPGDAFAVRSLVAEDDGELPTAPRLGPDMIARVVADTDVPLAIVLRHPAHATAVAWRPETWTLDVEPIAGAPPAAHVDALGVVTIRLAADASARIAIVRDGDRIAVGEVTGVAASDLASLEVVAGYLPPEEGATTHGPPIGARAILRTHAGDPVWGADVTWDVLEGTLPMWRDPARYWTADYIALADEEGLLCAGPPKQTGTRRATIVATLGDLRTEHELAWRERGEDSSFGAEVARLFGREDDGERSPHCRGPGFGSPGCGCTSTPASPPALAMLAFFVLLTRRRNRRAASSTHSPRRPMLRSRAVTQKSAWQLLQVSLRRLIRLRELQASEDVVATEIELANRWWRQMPQTPVGKRIAWPDGLLAVAVELGFERDPAVTVLADPAIVEGTARASAAYERIAAIAHAIDTAGGVLDLEVGGSEACIVLSGIACDAETRQRAAAIASRIAPSAQIQNDLVIRP